MPAEGISPRLSWTAVVLGIAFSVLAYGAVGVFLAQSGKPAAAPPDVTTLRWIVYGLAACSLFAGIFVFSRTSQDPDLAPSAFQRRSLISLALCEAGAIGGLVLLVIGRSLVDFLAPGMAVLGVIMLYILPRGLEYWRRVEDRA
jgi:hypothetical protein